MGFTLSMAPIREAGSGCEDEFEALIRRLGGKVNDQITPSGLDFPFLDDTNEAEDTAIIYHEEVGWSWWDMMVGKIAADCGPQAVQAMGHMKAWLGAAVPFDVPNQSIGDGSPATRYSEQTTLSPTPLKAFFQKLFGTPPPPKPPHELIDRMVSERSGGSGDFRVGSGPRILAELEAACRHWGLPEDETAASQRGEELYESAVENEEEIARCYALMCRSFFRYAIPNGYIVWFIK